MLSSEVLPQELRGKGYTLSTFGNTTLFFALAKASPIMALKENMGLWGTFIFYAVMNGVAVIIVMVLFP